MKYFRVVDFNYGIGEVKIVMICGRNDCVSRRFKEIRRIF